MTDDEITICPLLLAISALSMLLLAGRLFGHDRCCTQGLANYPDPCEVR